MTGDAHVTGTPRQRRSPNMASRTAKRGFFGAFGNHHGNPQARYFHTSHSIRPWLRPRGAVEALAAIAGRTLGWLQARAMSSPARLEVQVHCRRVAAVANLIAHHLFLPAGEKALLHAACLLHHHSIGLFAPKSAKRLLADVLEADAPGRVVAAPAPDQVGEVLSAYRIPGSGSAAAEKLAGILRLA